MKIKSPLPENNVVYDDLLLLMNDIRDYAIIRLDTKGNITSWNKGAEQIKDYTAAEAIGQNFSIFYSAEDIAAGVPQANLNVAMLNGSYSETGFRLRKDGSAFWGDMVITALYADDGSLRGFVKITRDISLQKQLSDELERWHLHASQTITERLNLTLKENTDYKHALDESAIIAITDRKGLIKHVNDNFCNISKYSREELIGKDHRIINSGYHDKSVISDLWTTITNGKIWKGELKNKAKDGSFYWVDTTIVPFLDKDGKPYQYIAIRSDITSRKQEEAHLKLLESVITNTKDAVLITDAALDEPGPRIVYVNEAFTRMTGYTAEEVVGKTPRLLQGPKTDKNELKRLSDAMRHFQHSEVTVVNYHKTGEEFWINFTVSAVSDDKGRHTNFIAIQRDVTQAKNKELELSVRSAISLIFNEKTSLNETLAKALELLADFGRFSIAEAWLIGTDKKEISRAARFSPKNTSEIFFKESEDVKSFVKGTGLPGFTWQAKTIQFWQDIDRDDRFIRRVAAKKAGIRSAYGLPLFDNTEIIGVLLFALPVVEPRESTFMALMESICSYLGPEIRRKQLEQELNQVFKFTPDILCIANTDGYFKKINPAMSALLEYSEAELLATPYLDLVHPVDRHKTFIELQNIISGSPTYYIENRYITKSGKTKWLAWTTTGASEQGTLYCSAKDITDKNELEVLLQKATELAHIGGWEIDPANGTVQWSAMAKEIHEVEPDFKPRLETFTMFYKEGEDRDYFTRKMKEVMEAGTYCDVELQIITAKGNSKWIRVICEAEFADDQCTRIYGSFQDIDARKNAEIAGKQALEERNAILESIGDAFFAVDKNWVVTYWNNMAEKLLRKPKEETIGRNLWTIYPRDFYAESYLKYSHALETNQAVHYERYNSVLALWLEVNIYPAGHGLSVYTKDITARKTAEDHLKQLNETLEKHTKELAIFNAELEQFAYVASHDLQEPLRMVTSFLSQLEKKYGHIVDDKGKRYIHFAVDGAKRMRQIILDLLEFSRVRKLEDIPDEVDLHHLVDDIMALYWKKIEDNKASITFSHLPIVQSHKTPIRQVLQNLIDNSLKYQLLGEYPIIHIAGEERDGHWLITVKDNGIGIDPAYFEKIFIIFQRLHNKDEYTGTGMGLAIAKKIIENLGGKIWVESAKGKGSTFYFTILKKHQP